MGDGRAWADHLVSGDASMTELVVMTTCVVCGVWLREMMIG